MVQLGIYSDKVLHPFLKQPVKDTPEINCQYIPKAGIMLCNTENTTQGHLKTIIISIIVLVIATCMFAINIEININGTEFSNESLLSNNSFILFFPVIAMIGGIFLGKVVRS